MKRYPNLIAFVVSMLGAMGLLLASQVPAKEDDSSSKGKSEIASRSLFDSVRFAENGKDLVVDLEQLRRALADGADPNWVDSQHERRESVLGNFAGLLEKGTGRWF